MSTIALVIVILTIFIPRIICHYILSRNSSTEVIKSLFNMFINPIIHTSLISKVSIAIIERRTSACFISLRTFRTANAVLSMICMTVRTLTIFHMLSDTVGIIIINLITKKKNIDKPSHVLKCIAMIKPKKAPTKCSAK